MTIDNIIADFKKQINKSFDCSSIIEKLSSANNAILIDNINVLLSHKFLTSEQKITAIEYLLS